MPKRRFQFSLAQILCWVTLAAILLAGVTWFPNDLPEESPTWPWLALVNEATLIIFSIAILRVIGSRSHYDFTLGFFAFGGTHLLFGLRIGVLDYDAYGGFLLHTLVVWGQLLEPLEEDGGELFFLADSVAVLLWGLIGGVYAAHLARRASSETARKLLPEDTSPPSVHSAHSP